MRIAQMHWQQVEQYLQHDDRAVLPLGSTEQHAYLSLAVDAILSERVATEAANPLGVPVFPALPYGLTPYFQAFPGTVSLRLQTYALIVHDLLDGLAAGGFRRILLVNGHGGNAPAQSAAAEWVAAHPDVQVKFHNWYNAPRTWATVQQIDPQASHASWMENFPWTRLQGVAMPSEQKPMSDMTLLRALNPARTRAYLGDGNYGGLYQRSDEEMLAIWRAGVEETRAAIEGPWGT